jgi:putative ABC transport system ATP-binding protein
MSKNQRAHLRNRKIGFVFQNYNLLAKTTAVENVELPLKYLNMGARERKERVTAMLKRMNISHRAQHFPQQLSGGQQQRVAIARACVCRPKLILADEPTGNLDSKNGREVMSLLSELNAEGTTIVMVTHSPKDAAIAQRTIDLFDGQIVNDLKNEL